jgi:hypothetical protein
MHMLLGNKGQKKLPDFDLLSNACVSPADLGNVLEDARQRHRTLIQTLVFRRLHEHVEATTLENNIDDDDLDEQEGTKTGGAENAAATAAEGGDDALEAGSVNQRKHHVPFSGRLSSSDEAIISAHGAWCQLGNLHQQLDFFCILMEVHGHREVECTAILDCVQRLLPCVNGGRLDQRDHCRLVAALQAVFCSSFPQVTSPMDHHGVTDLGLLKAHLLCLDAVFKFDTWQTSVCSVPSASERKLSIASKGSYDKSIYLLAWLQSHVKDHNHVTYLQVKPILVEKFGEDVFESCKSQVRDLLLKHAMPERSHAVGSGGGGTRSAVPNEACAHCAGDASQPCICDSLAPLQMSLVDRLSELLKESDYKDLTYSAIRQQLKREFGERAVDASKKSISVAVIHELNARREMRGSSTPLLMARRELKQELRRAMTARCTARFELVSELAMPDEFEGFEIVWAVRFVRALQADMKTCKALCPVYEEIMPGFQLPSLVFRAYDKLVAEQVKKLLARKEPRDPQEDLPPVFFELYFAMYSYWGEAVAGLPEETLQDMELRHYYRWFEPFVRHFMELSKVNGSKWIRNSLQLDTWKPVDLAGGELYSTSVLDVYRALFDILDFWEKLKWPDAEAAEEFLFAYLADSVCACVGFYGDAVLEIKYPEETKPDEFGDDGLFYFGKSRIQALNNLEEALVKFGEVKDYMRVDEVAASHLRRAQAANENHSGRVLPHKALRYFDEAERRLRSAMQVLADSASRLICQRVNHDLVLIARGFLHYSTDATAFVESSLSCMLDEFSKAEGDLALELPGETLAHDAASESSDSDSSSEAGSALNSGSGTEKDGRDREAHKAQKPSKETKAQSKKRQQQKKKKKKQAAAGAGNTSSVGRARTRSFKHQKARLFRLRKHNTQYKISLQRDGYLNQNLTLATVGLQYEATMDVVIGTIFRDIMHTLRDIVLGEISTPLSTVGLG